MTTAFNQVVKIYRKCEEKSFSDGAIYGNIFFTPEIAVFFSVIIKCKELYPFSLSRTGSGSIFDSDIDDECDLNSIEINSTIHLKLSLPQNEKGLFHKTIGEWLSRNSNQLDEKKLSSLFYIIENDCSSTEQSNLINDAKFYCELIEKLKDIANYHDGKSSVGSILKLVFVIPSKSSGGSKNLVVNTEITSSLFDCLKPDCSFLDSIIAEVKCNTDIHSNERMSVFKTSLIESITAFTKNENVSLIDIVNNWNAILESYKISWDNYLTGFSFHKLKAELAEQQTIFAQKLSDSVVSLSSKLITIPISIGALTFLEKQSTNSFLSYTLYYVSAFILCYTIRSTIISQIDCLKTIKDSYDISIGKVKSKHKLDSALISKTIESLRSSLNTTFYNLSSRLENYLAISWTPLLSLSVFTFYTNYNLWHPFYSHLEGAYFLPFLVIMTIFLTSLVIDEFINKNQKP